MDLQELINRGRFTFAGAPERLKLFSLIDGRKTALALATKTKRHVNNVSRDIRTLADLELIQVKVKEGQPVKKDGYTLYDKTPLARTVSISYFSGPTRLVKASSKKKLPVSGKSKPKPIALPSENEILDACKSGEDQHLEFKAAGTDVRKITKEIAALLNTREGGIIFYGVDDDGTIVGSDVTRQRFDQPLQNSIKNSIAPAATVTLRSAKVMGSELLVILVPPWNRADVYQFDEKVLLRKGTNVFAAKPEELKKLHKGEYVV